jgi:integrase
MKATERVRYPRGQGGLLKRPGLANWYSYIFVDGQEVIESTNTDDPRKARAFHRQRVDELALHRQGRQKFVGPAIKRLTVNEFLDALTTAYETRRIKSLDKTLSHLKPIRKHFGRMPAVSVHEEDIDRYIARRRDAGRSDATLNRELAGLSAALRRTVRTMRLPNPPTIRHLTENNTRQGFCERGELDAIVTHLPAYLHDAVRFAARCGWRKGEIVSLRWSDVDRVGHVIRLADTKNGKPRRLALDEDLQTLVDRRWRARTVHRDDGTESICELVFHRHGAPLGDFRKAWERACTTAGYPERLFHDLRRTAIRDMVRAGVREGVAMSISGHRTRSVFDRYNITNEDDQRDAMAKTATYQATAPTAPPPPVVPLARRVKGSAR